MNVRVFVSRVLKQVLPARVMDAIAYRAERRFVKRLGTKDRGAVFEAIYRDGVWGADPDGAGEFFSGSGSRTAAIVEPYVNAAERFLRALDPRPVVVEIGCGDFRVGSRLVDACARYVACDIVAPLIEHNRRAYVDPRLEFRVIDAVRETLPDGDVVIMRQVLQHLSNEDIAQIVPKLGAFRYALITEHLPSANRFFPNLDKPTGFDTRLNRSSGVALTSPPFGFRPSQTCVICEVPESVGIVRTIAYRT